MIKVTNIRRATLNHADHTYTDANGVQAMFSMSTIANRGAVMPDISIIKEAGAAGTLVHSIMHSIIVRSAQHQDDVVVGGDFIAVDFYKCLELAGDLTIYTKTESETCARLFAILLQFNFKAPMVMPEISLMADFNGIPVSGTADLIVRDQGHIYILDFKTAKMKGFTKEHHLQLYGYGLLNSVNKNATAHTIHLEGRKHLFNFPVSPWLAEEFEDNLNYLINKDKPKREIVLAERFCEAYNEYAIAIDQLKQERLELAKKGRELDKREKELGSLLADSLDTLGLDDHSIALGDEVSITLEKKRMHRLNYKPELEQYYDCNVSEEYILTCNDINVKIKKNGGENE